jgi:cellulose synthase/poly-beta-1,6-N-acetylglucosamine synthase-like glycosyltransferase
MTIAEGILWGSVGLITYTYVIYPVILFAAYAVVQTRRDLRYVTRRENRRCPTRVGSDLPAVSLVIPVYNELAVLPKKLQNVRELDYSSGRLQVIFVSDGSTDGSDAYLLKVDDANIDVVLLAEHMGKAGALNAGLRRARHDVVIFSDASTLFMADAVRRLVRHFVDPTVGVVCGALKFLGNAEFLHTEGTYWRYETALRLMEARLGATLTASGAIYAIRRQCYRLLTPDDLIDDFLIPMHARRMGLRVVFDPEAEATDVAGSSVGDEFARRVRLSVGSFRALRHVWGVRMRPFTALAFVSHKLLRWMLPVLFILAFASNVALLGHPFYAGLLVAQTAFYVWALAGYLFGALLRRVPFGLMAYFVVAMHMAFLVGLTRVLTNRRQVVWRREPRVAGPR